MLEINDLDFLKNSLLNFILTSSVVFFIIFLIHIALINLNFLRIKKEIILIVSFAVSYLFIYFININLSLNFFDFFDNFFYIAVVIIYLEFYSLINRGFSLSIIFSLLKKKLSLKQIEKYYAGKKGLIWMFNKRVNDLIFLKIIITKKKNIKFTFLGKLIFKLLNILRLILNIKKFG